MDVNNTLDLFGDRGPLAPALLRPNAEFLRVKMMLYRSWSRDRSEGFRGPSRSMSRDPKSQLSIASSMMMLWKLLRYLIGCMGSA